MSKKKFVLLFLLCAFAFQFVSNSLSRADIGLLPPAGEPILVTESPVVWKNIGIKILLPINIILMGPMLSFDEFLRDDPPPPFVAAVFIFYWTILALALHYLIDRIKH